MKEVIKRIGIIRIIALISSIILMIMAIADLFSKNHPLNDVLMPLCWCAVCLYWIAEILDGAKLRNENTNEILKRLKYQRAILKIHCFVTNDISLPEETRRDILKYIETEIDLVQKEIEDAAL